ncbi:hypothetical protein THRCLA_11882 [Thraustotheca clavata]|uniref:DnaJ homologue subfamily C GRV2/DNAJC13 N-terminal domain-containing protein n=1 Tax=Thraustotheca clavata TaxID=74557 RepID=A0A1V9Y5T2_9STRA|nr:hypothetical protein THRCLA_11882 [Thraustotheca clavata]
MQVFRSLLGAAGSLEQRNAIKDVISLADGRKRPKEEVLQVLHVFCDVFPLEAERKSNESDEAINYDVKDRKLYDAVYRLLKTAVETSAASGNEGDVVLLLLDTIKRILKWRELHKLVPKYSTKPALTCMMWSKDLALSVLQVILMMIVRPQGLKSAEIGDKIEMMNKRTFADDRGYTVLCSLLTQYSIGNEVPEESEISCTILQQALQIFYITLLSHKLTSDSITIERAAEALLNARVTLLRLSHHQDEIIRQLSVDLLLELFMMADLDQVTFIQDSARESGALLYMLLYSLEDIQANDGQDARKHFQEKAIHLVEMFCAGNARSKACMYRILPVELFVPIEDRPDLISKYSIATLKKATKVTQRKSIPVDFPYVGFPFEAKFSASSSMGTRQPQEFQRWLQDARAQGEKWVEVLLAARQTHQRPNLVWRALMLQELQKALSNEIASFEKKQRALADSQEKMTSDSKVLWEYDRFQVTYTSFSSELIVHGYFIEHLIPKLADLSDPYEVDDLVVLAWHLSDRLSVETNPHWRHCMVKCLRLMMRRYAMTFNGQVPVAGLLQYLADNELDPSFACEAFLLFHVAISTSRTRPTESLTPFYASVLSVVLNILDQAQTYQVTRESTASIASTMSEPYDLTTQESFHLRLTFNSSSTTEVMEDEAPSGKDTAVDMDGTIRAGVNIILVILQRAKYFVSDIVKARFRLAKLFGCSYLSHRTVGTLLTLISQMYSYLNTEELVIYKRSLLPLILIACSNDQNRGMSIPCASFLYDNYTPEEIRSLLQTNVGFNGCGLHLLLLTPIVFAEIFNHNNIRSADVMWGSMFRHRLYSSLCSQQNIACVVDDDDGLLSDYDIPVGHIFLKSFVEHSGSFRSIWTQEMHEETLAALAKQVIVTRTKSMYAFDVNGENTDPMFLQVLALKALVQLIPTSAHEIALDPAIYEALLNPLRRTLLGEIDQERACLAMKICRFIITPELENVNAPACKEAIFNGSTMQLFREALEKTLHPRYVQFLQEQHTEDDKAMAMALLQSILDLLLAMAEQDDGYTILVSHPRWIVQVLAHTSSSHILQGKEKIAEVCLRFCVKLCSYPALLQLFLDAGGLIVLSDVCLTVDYHQPETQPATELAARVLQSCLQYECPPAINSLTQLYTPGLLRLLLRSPIDFLQNLQSEESIYQPMLVWTTLMKQQLREAIRHEQAKIQLNSKSKSTWPVWDADNFVAADSFRYLYSEVANEVLVSHVYLRAFVENELDELPDMADFDDFTKELLQAKESSEAAVASIKARGGNPQKQQALLDLFRSALRKIALKATVNVPLPQLIEVDGFSDTESVGDTIQNLQESPTNHGPPSQEKPSFNHQESIPLDEVVV